jgi:DNA processing protein
MNPEVEQAAYVLALSQVEGLGVRSLPRVLKFFPTPNSLVEASSELIHENLGENLSRIVRLRLLDRWEQSLSSSQQSIALHLERKVVPIPFTDAKYPCLLKLIPDPPPLLYVKGDVESISSPDSIAIVGTRSATERGKEVANRVAKYFGKNGYVIVSGLAKGIDTAAHKGAIDSGAKTVAVLGTPLDQIYPAENRALADRIANDSGALITELPLGRQSFRNAFVQRDRIQSGMSLAVIPVQTDVAGGTMHTVRYAEAQGRLLLCPKPLESEQDLKQYAGISELIRSSRAREFRGEDYESLLELFQEHKKKLLSLEAHVPEAKATTETPAVQEKPRRKRKKPAQQPQTALGFVEPQPDVALSISEEDLEKMVQTARQLGLDSNARKFDKVVSQIREKLFGPRRSSKRSESKLP